MITTLFEPTDKTPLVEVDAENSFVKISGVCTPQNPQDFFIPMMEYIFASLDIQHLRIEIYLRFFNTGASKSLLNLLLEIKKRNPEIEHNVIKWIYEKDDEELRESGEILQEISKIPFEYEETKAWTN
jgi:SiaC family regulatory phosphoprotein